jgi:hypothetical protein
MARAKASEPQRSRSKQNAIEELNRGITTLRELNTQIDDLGRDGFPYREAVRARTELSFRETIRRLFGEKSPEYQAHKNHKLRIGTRAESAQSTTLLKELIVQLENQKAELLGLTPAETAPPPPAARERPHADGNSSKSTRSSSRAIPGGERRLPRDRQYDHRSGNRRSSDDECQPTCSAHRSNRYDNTRHVYFRLPAGHPGDRLTTDSRYIDTTPAPATTITPAALRHI